MAGDGAATLADEFKTLYQLIAENPSLKDSVTLSKREFQAIVDGLRAIEEECENTAHSDKARLLVIHLMCSVFRRSAEQHL